MKLILYIALFSIAFISCNKNDAPEGPILPVGAVPYEASEVAIVPYSAGDYVFKKSPDFTEEFTINFKERLATEEAYAWDQTFFTLSFDPVLELELRLRYLQAEDEYHKSLAIYMPYRDEVAVIRKTVFETPIDPTILDESFFDELVTFHEMIEINGVEWLDVYEINPLTSTDSSIDSDTYFTKIYFNAAFGLIQLDQKNGDVWILHP